MKNGKQTVKRFLSLVLTLTLLCGLAVPTMAAESVEYITHKIKISTPSDTRFRSYEHEGMDNTGAKTMHSIGELEVPLTVPKSWLYEGGNQGQVEFSIDLYFVESNMDGELGYALQLRINFYEKTVNQETGIREVYRQVVLGDGDETFTVSSYSDAYNPQVHDKDWETMSYARITNKDVSRVAQAGFTLGTITTNDTYGSVATVVNMGSGLDMPEAGQILISKTISGLDQKDMPTDEIYFIEVQGQTDDLSYYKLLLSQGKEVTNEDGSSIYHWSVPVLPSVYQGLSGPVQQTYLVTENRYFIPGYTCNASYTVVQGDGSYTQNKTEGTGGKADPIYIHTNKYGSVDFVNAYSRNSIDKTDREYVIDFGLPIDIKVDDLSLTMLDENGNTIPITDRGVQVSRVDFTAAGTLTYGTVEVTDDGTASPIITYTPNKIVNGSDTIGSVNVWLNNRESADYNFDLIVYPATSVMYEEEFVTFKNSSAATVYGVWSDTTPIRSKQATEAIGSLKNVYGYDPAYATGTQYSMDSAKQVVVNKAVCADGSAPTASFSFTGTGFDIISMTDNTSGAIFVTVSQNGKAVKQHVVDTYYGYNYVDGEWKVVDSENALYQIPVMKVEGLTHGTYDVTISVSYSSIFDQSTAEGYTFLLDAVRIYDPIMGTSIDEKYAQDGEASPEYKPLRDVLLDSDAFSTDDETTGSVFIDGISDGTATVTQYANQGPNNEVYLAKGQAIAFQLQVSDISDITALNLQIGAKLAKGDSATLKLNGEDYINLATATDMYYDLGGKLTWNESNGIYTADVVLSNDTEGSIISLTNLKLTGDAKFYSESKARSVSPMVRMMVSRSFANEVVAGLNGSQAEAFVPEYFEASWNTCSAGGYAMLTVYTSTDVESLTVNGQQFTNCAPTYRAELVDGNYVSVCYKMWTIHIQMETSGDKTFEITAYDSEGTASEGYMTSVTVY